MGNWVVGTHNESGKNDSPCILKDTFGSREDGGDVNKTPVEGKRRSEGEE